MLRYYKTKEAIQTMINYQPDCFIAPRRAAPVHLPPAGVFLSAKR
jgi:hypothetical protein